MVKKRREEVQGQHQRLCAGEQRSPETSRLHQNGRSGTAGTRYLGLIFHLFSSAHADAGYCADDDQHIWNKCCALIEQLYFSESASIPASSPGRRGLSFLLWSWKAKGVKLETMTSTFKGALSLNSRLQLQIAITQSRTVCICNKQHFGHRNSSTDLLSLLLLRWVGDTASA